MRRARFKSALRSILDNAGDGLMWVGLIWMVPPLVMSDAVATYPRGPGGRRCHDGCLGPPPIIVTEPNRDLRHGS
jgi:hypothetical protein